MLIRVTLDSGRHVRHRREAAHATRVRSHVAVFCALVVARGCKRQDALPITEEQQGTLATPDKLLEQQRTSTSQTLDGRHSLTLGCRDDDPLAGGQAVRFHNEWKTHISHMCQRSPLILAANSTSRRDPVPFAKPLGEGFAPLEPCPHCAWTNDQQIPGTKDVGDPLRKWFFRPDDDQADPVPHGELGQSRRVIRTQWNASRTSGDTRIAGSHPNMSYQGALPDLPCQRMFPSTTANDEDIHGHSLVPEVPYAGKQHCDAGFVCSSDRFGVLDRSARLDDGADSCSGRCLDRIRKGEEPV